MEGGQTFFSNQGVAALIILDRHFHIVIKRCAGIDIGAIAADEAAHRAAAANHLKPLAKGPGGLHNHGALIQVGGHKMRFDAGFFQQLEEMQGHFEVGQTHARDGQAHRVGAWVNTPSVPVTSSLKRSSTWLSGIW